MAPESLFHKTFSSKSDVWAFGLVLVEIWTEKEIYEGMATIDVIDLVCMKKGHHWIPGDIPAPYAAAMAQCWEFEPELRPSMNVLKQQLNRTN
jgi:hypothetical protein